MAQFRYYIEGKFDYWTDPVTHLRTRFGQLAGVFRVDYELDATGFSGVEDVNWTNNSTHQGVLSGTYREGVLSTNYVLQVGTDFNGVENVDYETLITA